MLSGVSLLALLASFTLPGGINSQIQDLPGQNEPIVYTDWTPLGESPDMFDVSYRIVKCSSAAGAQVHLHVFNENMNSSSVSFKVNVTDNVSGDSFVQSIDHAMAFGDMHSAECGSSSNNDLSIAVPNGYDPANTSVEIEF